MFRRPKHRHVARAAAPAQPLPRAIRRLWPGGLARSATLIARPGRGSRRHTFGTARVPGLRCCWLLTLLLFGGGARADDLGLLLRVVEAAQHTNYRGAFIYRSDAHLDSFALIHRYNDGREDERIIALSGQPRVLLRQSDRLYVQLPDDPQLRLGRQSRPRLLPQLEPADMASLAQFYRMGSAGNARVAGRSCREFRLHPVDSLRYGYRFCADEQTWVPLRFGLFDADGQVLEEMMFTQIEFPAHIADTELALPEPAGAVRDVNTHDDGPGAVAGVAKAIAEVGRLLNPEAPALPTRFPAGYRLLTHEQRGATPDGGVEHLLLSDGLALVSVFRAPATDTDPPALRGSARAGSINAYGRLLGAHRLTVVGAVPSLTVRLIADSFPVVPPLVDAAAARAPDSTASAEADTPQEASGLAALPAE